MKTMLHNYPNLFVSWRSPHTRRILPIARLRFEAATHQYEFQYIQSVCSAISEGFTPFPDFPDLSANYRSKQLFPLFGNRVMPSSRPGYSDFLSSLGLSLESANPMVILARTGGGRQTDQIELFPMPTAEAEAGCYTTHCLLRAIRYMPQPATELRIQKLRPNEQLFMMPDPQNPVDPSAIAVRTDDNVMIGYLPAYLTSDTRVLQDQCLKLDIFVARVNPPPAEVHHRLLCRIVSCWPQGFQPFATPPFQPYLHGA
jgi:HIRAN domain